MPNQLRFVGIAGLLTAALACQSPIVAPTGYATTEGGTNNTFPWSRGTSSMRFQQIYDSSHFTGQAVVSPILISQLRFRANGSTSTWAGGSWPNVRIDMSTAAVDYLTPSTTFDSNHGGDRSTVLQGAVTVTGGTGGGTTVPGPWYVDIPLQTPFVYDPAGGDLLLDVFLDGTGWTGASTPTDAVSGVAASPAPPLGSRIYDTSGITGTTGTVTVHHMLTTEFTFTPAVGLYPAFTSDVRTGGSPLAVQFSDRSFSSAPGGVVAWQWDVDGDGVTDYTTPNPTHVYTACGTYNVSLTVIDTVNGAQTITRQAWIETDVVTPDFTWQLSGPGIVQFLDQSTPTPTSWAWDLDGDGIVDSTAQNPVWIYPATCTSGPAVTLTVNRLCRGPFTKTRPVFVATSIDGPRDGATSTSTGSANVFDLDVTNPLGISVCQLETKTTAAVGAPISIDVFLTPNTYVGATTTQSLWRQVLSVPATGTGSGATAPLVTLPLSPPLYLPQGRYGVMIRVNGASVQYGSVGNTSYGSPDATVYTGAVQGTPFSGTLLSPRYWNGALRFSTCAATGDAGYQFFQAGCAGSAGVPGNRATTRPQLGQTLAVDFTNLPQNATFLMIGFSKTASPFGPLPVDLGAYGAPGCFGRVSPDGVLLLLGSGGTAVWNLAIPNSPGLQCVRFFTQGMSLDPGLNALGLAASDAAAMIIGL